MAELEVQPAEPGRQSRLPGMALIAAGLAVLFAYPWFYDRYIDPSTLGKQIRDARAQVARDPRNVDARLNLAFLYERKGALRQARGEAEAAARLAPDNPSAHLMIGMVRLESGDYAGAVKEYERALALKPKWGAAYFGLGRAYQGLGRLQDAIGSYRQAALYLPQSAVVQESLAAALKAAGKQDEAAAAEKRAAELKQLAEQGRLQNKQAKQ